MPKKTDVFKKAKSQAKKQAKAKEDTVELEGLYNLTSIQLVIDALSTLKKKIDAEVRDRMVDAFVANGIALQHQPSNFTGEDQGATASCQLRKRSTKSVLTETEVELLTEHGVSTEEIIVRDEAFFINPVYTRDQKLLGRISKKLKEIKDLPEDFIQFQAKLSGTATTKTSLDEVFINVRNADVVKELLSIVATTAINNRLEGFDINKGLKLVKQLLAE